MHEVVTIDPAGAADLEHANEHLPSFGHFRPNSNEVQYRKILGA